MDILENFEPSQTYAAGDVIPEQIGNKAFVKLPTFLQGINFEFVNQYQLEQTLRLAASWYGFTTKNNGTTIRCCCSKLCKDKNADKKRTNAETFDTNFYF